MAASPSSTACRTSRACPPSTTRSRTARSSTRSTSTSPRTPPRWARYTRTVESLTDLEDAVRWAKTTDRTTVLVVKTDAYTWTPGDAWWDVGVPEVSTRTVGQEGAQGPRRRAEEAAGGGVTEAASRPASRELNRGRRHWCRLKRLPKPAAVSPDPDLREADDQRLAIAGVS